MQRPSRDDFHRIRIACIACMIFALVATACLTTQRAFANAAAVEDEFEKAIKLVTPATVVCLPKGFPGHMATSGVVISRKGLVLSDSDVGAYISGPIKRGVKPNVKYTDDVEVRIPNLKSKGRGYKSLKARVILRDKDHDTSLIQITDVPSRGLAHVEIGSSDDMQTGDFAFVTGNSFGMASEGTPTLTAGVISALIPAKDKSEGKYENLYTSAAVNRGVNGGPIVDVEGRLIGTISTFMGPKDRYQYLGKAVPIDRLRAFYLSKEATKDLFPKSKKSRDKSKRAGRLEAVFHHVATTSYPGLVSLTVERSGDLEHIARARGGRQPIVNVPRYTGATSGFVIDKEGYIVTALYNLASVEAISQPRWLNPPANAKVAHGISQIKSIRVHFVGGESADAELVGYNEDIGVALLKVKGDVNRDAIQPLQPAPIDAYQAGRFVVAVGHPFGDKPLRAPLTAVGILSKQHRVGASDPWAGQWQTDASCTDATCGGAAMNIHGKLLGMLSVWSPIQHGRGSGIGFIVPWPMIQEMLPALKRGKRPPLVGVIWGDATDDEQLVIGKVIGEGPAAKAGLKADDIVLKIDSRTIKSMANAKQALKGKWAGDVVSFLVKRGGIEVKVDITLGERKR